MKCLGTICLSYIVRCACALQSRRQDAAVPELLDDSAGQLTSRHSLSGDALWVVSVRGHGFVGY